MNRYMNRESNTRIGRDPVCDRINGYISDWKE